jgi:hypothetical protein
VREWIARGVGWLRAAPIDWLTRRAMRRPVDVPTPPGAPTDDADRNDQHS